jgi:hypothetical protein
MCITNTIANSLTCVLHSLTLFIVRYGVNFNNKSKHIIYKFTKDDSIKFRMSSVLFRNSAVVLIYHILKL